MPLTSAYPSAGLGRRLASLLYEGLVLFAVLLIGFWLPQALLLGNGIQFSAKQLWLHVFLLLMFYCIWFWINGGQTLPMKTWRLRIINASGGAPRPTQALLRYLACWPSLLLGGIGILWALFDQDRQFLHDRIAGTRIIQETTTQP